MKRYIIDISTLLFLLFLASCKPSIDTPIPAAGTVDFSKYIAIGNSLTAGYSNGGLYLEGQQVSFPNLLAKQIKAAGGGEFTSPFFSEEQKNGSGYLRLVAIENGVPELREVEDHLAYRDANKWNLTKNVDPIQNLGIPGMRLDLAFLPVFSALNNYFERLLPTNRVGIETYFKYSTRNKHSFFTFWLGNNDVLGYAINGGVITDPTNMLTSKETFKVLYNKFVEALTSEGQKGVLATIPDVTAIPFFTTLTIDDLLTAAKDAAPDQANQLTAIYIEDETAPGGNGLLPIGVRPAISKQDFVVLNFPKSKLGKLNNEGFPYGLHPENPIEDEYILDKNEVFRVKEYVESYNQSIKEIAESKGLAVADANLFLSAVNKGLMINGAFINAEYITGGAFSLDGIHLTPKGNALIANLFIEEINKKYGTSLSKLDVNKYKGVVLP